MQTERPRVFTEILYHEAAQEYLRSLPLEHFMEATPQAHQREITLASLSLVHAQRPEVQYFNELLVQYPVKGRKKPKQVVPDNMVVIHPEPIRAEGSFDLPLQPAQPFWMLEYVSRSSKRKDYDDNMQRYEHELRVPYYLLFQPDVQELTLYRHNDTRYVSVKPNEAGRFALQELELEAALLDGWVRFWFRGELLPLPADLLRQVGEFRQLWQDERRRADDEKRRADDEKHRADDEKHRADDEKHRADDAEQRAAAAEQELARLRALLEKQS
jgi:Uma2 family endonuclease